MRKSTLIAPDRSHQHLRVSHCPFLLRQNAQFRAPQFASRRKGFVALYVALGLSGFLGVTALVVDLGNLFTRRAQAQRAADAAALAGALEIPKGRSQAEAVAREYSRTNGYDDARSEVLSVTFLPAGSPSPSRIQVQVQRNEPLYFLPAFAALLGQSQSISKVGATAIAEVSTPEPQDLPITFGGEYGTSQGVANPSVFGPQAEYQHGDAYSPEFLQDGTTPNVGTAEEPKGVDFPGYEYKLTIANDYQALNGTDEVQLEIFDPECYSPNYLEGWDEIRNPNPGIPNPGPAATTTRYTIIAPNGQTVGSVDYADDPESNLLWTAPPALKFKLSDYGGPGAYRVIVKAIQGSSENGFQFRSGRPHDGLRTRDEEAQWRQDYYNNGSGNGTSLTATGKVPMNFTSNGNVSISLGFVPEAARGGKVTINKFDTDVGFQDITYRIDAMGTTSAGTKAENGQWGTPDVISVPDSYPSGGSNWSVSYTAGPGDTSVWSMNWSSTTPGLSTSTVRLVG